MLLHTQSTLRQRSACSFQALRCGLACPMREQLLLGLKQGLRKRHAGAHVNRVQGLRLSAFAVQPMRGHVGCAKRRGRSV
jgi:hypothetical protein